MAPLADEIARYIVDRRLGRPAIVGHSMGGTLAMMIAARRPELAGRIMVVDMLPQPAGLFGGSAAGVGPLAGSLGNLLATPGGRRLFGGLMSAFSPPDAANRRSDPDVVGRDDARARGDRPDPRARPHPRAADRGLRLARPARPRRDRPQLRRAPTPRARGARLVRIDGSGHMVMLDQPARFRAALSGVPWR